MRQKRARRGRTYSRHLSATGLALALLAGCSSGTETTTSTAVAWSAADDTQTPTVPVPDDTDPSTTTSPTGTHTMMVPMPDGIGLATTIYLPEDGSGPWPSVLQRTPYGRESVEDFIWFGEILSEEGVVAIVQDQRGRYDSEGEDIGFFADTADGQATLDWIVAQPWSNGRVATEGGSAQGIAQYLLAPGASDALTCQWIDVATPDFYSDAVYQGGVFREALAGGWLEDIGSSHLIAEYMSQPLDGDYWDAADITDAFEDVHVPAYHVGGYLDIFARGIVTGFLGYQYEGGEGAAGRQHLVLGPWAHGVDESTVGEATYPAAGNTHVFGEWQGIWYEVCVYGHMDMSELDALPTVSYFTMGAVGEADAPGHAWHTAETWPPKGFTETRLYLQSNNTLATAAPEQATGGDPFAYDPDDPSPTICGANLLIEAGSCDQRPVEEREDVIVYTSAELDVPLEVTGDLYAEIWITTDVPDTDIVVRLTDVYPDGRSMLVADGILRARYQGDPDFTSFELLEPDTPYLLTLDLGPTSIIFNAGHRIRVSVTSSNWPRFGINPNTGEMFLKEGDVGRIARTTILRDAEHPSALVVPTR